MCPKKSFEETVETKNLSSSLPNCTHIGYTFYDFGETLQVLTNLHTPCVSFVRESRLNVVGLPSTFTFSERKREVTSPRSSDSYVICPFYDIIVVNIRFITTVSLSLYGRITVSLILSFRKVKLFLVSSSLVTETFVSSCDSYNVTEPPTLTGSVSLFLVVG